MFRRIRKHFADPFSGDALVANCEFVTVPSEDSDQSRLAPAFEFAGITEANLARRQDRPQPNSVQPTVAAHQRRRFVRLVRRGAGTGIGVLGGALLLSIESGSASGITLIATIGVALIVIGALLYVSGR